MARLELVRAVRCGWQRPSLFLRSSFSPWTRRAADVTSGEAAPFGIPFMKLLRSDGCPDNFCRRFKYSHSHSSSHDQTDPKCDDGSPVFNLADR